MSPQNPVTLKPFQSNINILEQPDPSISQTEDGTHTFIQNVSNWTI